MFTIQKIIKHCYNFYCLKNESTVHFNLKNSELPVSAIAIDSFYQLMRLSFNVLGTFP